MPHPLMNLPSSTSKCWLTYSTSTAQSSTCVAEVDRQRHGLTCCMETCDSDRTMFQTHVLWRRFTCMDRQAEGETKNSCWRGEIAASGGNIRKLWRPFNSVLGNDRTNETTELSADEFATFFQDNVDSVRLSTQSTIRCPVPVNTDTWWVDCWRGQQVDQCGSLQGMSTRFRPHLVS